MRGGKLSLFLTFCSTWESRPSTLPGQPIRDVPECGVTGKSAPSFMSTGEVALSHVLCGSVDQREMPSSHFAPLFTYCRQESWIMRVGELVLYILVASCLGSRVELILVAKVAHEMSLRT